MLLIAENYYPFKGRSCQMGAWKYLTTKSTSYWIKLALDKGINVVY